MSVGEAKFNHTKGKAKIIEKKKKKKKTVFLSLVGFNFLRGAHCDRQNNNNQQQQQRRNQSAAHLDLHSLRDDGW
jgi:hypothetical protein